MLSITETQLQQHWPLAINQCLEAHDILQVIRDQGDGFVVLSTQDWRAIEETLYLNQFAGLVDSIQQAHQEPLEQGIPLEELGVGCVPRTTRAPCGLPKGAWD